MNKTIAEMLVKEVKEAIAANFVKADEKVFFYMLNAYNRYCEDEMNGANYIFDMNKQKDFICLVKGGMTLVDAQRLGQCRFLIERDKQYVVLNQASVINCMLGLLDEIVECILKYPFVEEYKIIYQMFVTEGFEDLGM